MKTQTLTNILLVLLGIAIALVGMMVWSTVDYHAKCDAVVVTDTIGNRYCVDKATLVQNTSTNYNK